MAEGPIGFIGLGIMGMPMCENLLKAGYPVVAYNRTSSKAKALAAEVGDWVTVAANPREVAEACPIIITIVSDSPDVEKVVLGPKGISEGIQRDAVVIDMSTISPAVTRDIAASLAKENGAHMLDAPVSGGSGGAAEGTLSIMVGGEEAIFQRCLPVFEAMGGTVTYMGPSGMGQTTKAVNQILVAGNMNAAAEAVVFAAKAGLDLDKAFQAVSSGAAGSRQLQGGWPSITKGNFAPGFMVSLLHKDLSIVLDTASQLDMSLPGTSLIREMYASLDTEGRGTEGTTAIVRVHERNAGIEARVKG